MGGVQRILSVLVFSVPLVVFPVHLSFIFHKSLVLGALTALAVGFAVLVTRRDVRAAPVFPFALPLGLYLGSAALSLTQAVNLPEGGSQLLLIVTGIALFWLVANYAGTPDAWAWLLSSAALAGVIVSLVGIAQFWLGEIPGLPQLLPPASTFGNKALAAQFVVLVLPLPYLFFFFHREPRRELLWGVCGGIILLYLLYTRSRGAWLSSLGALAVVLVWLRLAAAQRGTREGLAHLFAFTRRKALILLGVAGCVTLILMGPEYVPARGAPEPLLGELRSLVTPREYATGIDRYRLAWWANTVPMIRDHPILGVGLGNWQFLYPRYARNVVIDPALSLDASPNAAHNDYLQILAETGPVGLLAFLWILLSLARRSWQGVFATGDRFVNLTILALGLGLLALLGHALVDFPFELPVPTAFFWIFAGMLWAASSPPKEGKGGSRLNGLVCWTALALLVALYTGLNLAMVRADYHFARALGYDWPWKPPRPHASLEQIRTDLQEVKTAIARYPFQYQYHLAEGILQLRLETYPEAARANLRALRLHPYSIPAHINLGLSYMGTGESEKAETALKRALEIWPDSAGAHNNLGIHYAALGRWDEARAEFLTALRLKPGDEIARHNLRILLRDERAIPKREHR